MKSTKSITIFEISQEIKCFLSEDKAKKIGSHVNLEAIKHLRKKGKKVRAVLMKNNLVTYIIQSPLWVYFEKGDITADLFAAGIKYSEDYLEGIRYSMAQPIYEGEFIGTGLSTGKELPQSQIEAAWRIFVINKNLNKKEVGANKSERETLKEIDDNQYQFLLELFLIEEIGIEDLRIKIGIRRNSVKKKIIEALRIVSEVYKNPNSFEKRKEFNSILHNI